MPTPNMYYLRALEIDTKTYGRNSGELVHVLNNLGLLYGAEARNSEAEALHLRALTIAPKALWQRQHAGSDYLELPRVSLHGAEAL